MGAGVFVAIALAFIRPSIPTEWGSILVIGAIAAIRIQIISVAAKNPAESAKVSILSGLAFLWLAIAEVFQGHVPNIFEYLAMALVLSGVYLSSQKSYLRSAIKKQWANLRNSSWL
ncbi:MAG: hypothetical protein QE271_01785 [Bacteriovoracaceae bacterium]|nr:hypothetical protein [Bacteriovoracaceae bacterium]